MNKMKVLWLCNFPLPEICARENIPQIVGEGWLINIAHLIDENPSIDLVLCAPTDRIGHLKWGDFGFNSKYVLYYQKESIRYSKAGEELFREIIELTKPDIVNIFGTEYAHSLEMVKAYNNPRRTVIHIQGLISSCAEKYEAFLPTKVINMSSFRDFVKRDNIRHQKGKFIKRGNWEKKAIKGAQHIFGRTEWDKQETFFISPQRFYYEIPEILREEFYSGCWDYEECVKNSIFMSQGSYPLKGLHIMIEAMGYLKSVGVIISLNVAGYDMLKNDNFIDVARRNYYQIYIKKLIKKFNLENQIHFLGPLDASEMKKQFLRHNIFVLPSVLENSSNSIGEAQLLGVPIIAAKVGGVSSLIKDDVNGLLYPADEPRTLAWTIKELLENVEKMKELSCNSKVYAEKAYDRNRTLMRIIEAYNEILAY